MEKRDVDRSTAQPAISIEQKTTPEPRSTVGTVTEIYDYLRLLFARIGTPHCYNCGKPIQSQTPQTIVDGIKALPEGTRVQLMAPVVRQRKGTYQKAFEDIKRRGYVRVRVDGEFRTVDDDIDLERYVKHDIDVVVDRLVVKEGIGRRLTDSVEACLKLGEGIIRIWRETPDKHVSEVLQSEHFACIYCGLSVEELTPRMFFNTPGDCPTPAWPVIEIDPDSWFPTRLLHGGGRAPGACGVPTHGTPRVAVRVQPLRPGYGHLLGGPARGFPADRTLWFGRRGHRLHLLGTEQHV